MHFFLPFVALFILSFFPCLHIVVNAFFFYLFFFLLLAPFILTFFLSLGCDKYIFFMTFVAVGSVYPCLYFLSSCCGEFIFSYLMLLLDLFILDFFFLSPCCGKDIVSYLSPITVCLLCRSHCVMADYLFSLIVIIRKNNLTTTLLVWHMLAIRMKGLAFFRVDQNTLGRKYLIRSLVSSNSNHFNKKAIRLTIRCSSLCKQKQQAPTLIIYWVQSDLNVHFLLSLCSMRVSSLPQTERITFLGVGGGNFVVLPTLVW